MDVKRGMALAAAIFVGSPLALGGGIIMLIAALDDEESPGLSGGGLRVGEKGVPAEYAGLIVEAAAACDEGLPAAILAAQIQQESGFNPDADSGVAKGIAQFKPSTWATSGVDGNGDGVKDIWDPEDAIPAQGQLMCELLKKAKTHPEYDGSPMELALAGYNAGWGRVQQYQGVPPKSFADGQTYHYVETIMETSSQFVTVDTMGSDSLEDAPKKVQIAVSWALKQKGGWYQWGGDCTDAHGDNPAHWCDCSSLMQQAYKHAGIDIPRTTFDQVNIGRPVDIDNPRPGDLVFNPGAKGSDARPGHVGMYIGDGKIIEAPRTGVRTRLVPYSSWRHSTSEATRISKVVRVVEW